MMSRKDYVRAAEIIRTERALSSVERACLISTFVEFFQDDNPRFNPDRFRRACEPVDRRARPAPLVAVGRVKSCA
jgi:hypothetical protein